MNHFICSSLIVLFTELISLPVFWALRKFYGREAGNSRDQFMSVLKGMLERVVLFVALVNDVPTIVVFFGAIKLGTRITDTSSQKISNDYFLIGNLTSMLIGLGAFSIYRICCK